jgi:hypothetical protein
MSLFYFEDGSCKDFRNIGTYLQTALPYTPVNPNTSVIIHRLENLKSLPYCQ